jgi:anti-anti-sigma regulatory factor
VTPDRRDLPAVVIGHIVDILGGTCSISREQIAAAESDTTLSEILTGLLYLHEDLVYRDDQRDKAEREANRAIERLAEQNAELEASRQALARLAAELATPVITVSDRVLMMPLVGTMDAKRAGDIAERLLTSIVKEKAHHVIIDVTGIGTLDTGSADCFMRLLAAVNLLGANAVIAGVQPHVSLTMVALGLDFKSFRTARTVHEALALCTTKKNNLRR